MNGNQLVELLGYSSIAPPLDDFLSLHGVTKKPKTGNDVGPIKDKKSGLAFEYLDPLDFEENVGRPRSEGRFVLRGVDFYADEVDGYTGFNGNLPFNLTFATNETEMEKLLGAPRKKRAGDKKESPVSTYCVGDRLIVVGYPVGGTVVESRLADYVQPTAGTVSVVRMDASD